MKKERNSSIELLKIISIFIIIISHSVPMLLDVRFPGNIVIGYATKNPQELILLLFRTLGSIGNIIFITCSSYFLLESKKNNIKKIMYIMLDSFILSISFLVICLLLNYSLSTKEIMKAFMPITFANNWFIGCYLLFYLLHPLLNIIIKKINKKQLLIINLFNIILYCGINFILKDKFYFNELIGFIIIYFIVAYFKLHLKNISNSKKINLLLLIGSISCHILLILITNYLGLHSPAFFNKQLYWNNLSNPFDILIGISLLNLFKSKKFINKKINYISSLSLIIYLLHENIMFKKEFFVNLYRYIYNNYTYKYISLWVLLIAVITFIISVILATIYKETIQKILKKVCDKIYDFLSPKLNYLLNYLEKLN